MGFCGGGLSVMEVEIVVGVEIGVVIGLQPWVCGYDGFSVMGLREDDP